MLWMNGRRSMHIMADRARKAHKGAIIESSGEDEEMPRMRIRSGKDDNRSKKNKDRHTSKRGRGNILNLCVIISC
jgi:hypothetical protein